MTSNTLRGVLAAMLTAGLVGVAPTAQADSTDDLVNALMAKGVLTEEEGQMLLKGRQGEKAAEDKKKESEVKASFKDGIVWESGDKQHRMQVHGRVQGDYRSFNHEYDKSGGNQTDTWDVRRAYLGAKGTFYNTYDFDLTFDGSSSANGLDLYTAWFNIRWWDQAQFKFGQFKQPMGMEELTTSRFLNFTERSYLASLVPSVDRGAQVTGEFKGFTYALGYFNGVGYNKGKNTDDVTYQADGKSLTGRVTVNLAELLDNKDAVFHVGAAYSRTRDSDATGANNANTSISLRSEGRGTDVFLSETLSSGYDLNRAALEGAVAYGPVKFSSEWLNARFKPDGNTALVTGATSGKDYDITAWYASVNWMITGEGYAGTYKNGLFGGRMKPKNDFDPRNGKYGWGAWEVGLRYSKLDASDFEKDMTANAYSDGIGQFNEADAITLGLKWIPNPNTRFLINYIDTSMDCVSGVVCDDDKEKAVNFRAQFDF